MLICLVTSTLIFLKGTESSLLEPVRKCVPTATVEGPCHTCVCSTEGVFHCRRQKCIDKDLDVKRPIEDCESNYVYREDNTFCTCVNYGTWKSKNCENLFQYIKPKIPISRTQIKTNVACMANKLYLIDCNVCLCATSGVIDVTLCTNRQCAPGHKADTCNYGDVLRLDHEVCSCSNISYYIDRLCINIVEKVAQTLTNDQISNLIDISSPWRRLNDPQASSCDPKAMYTVDCNQCVCKNGKLVCSKKVCEHEITKSSLRDTNPKVKEFITELKNLEEECDPGKKYRFECNTCVCSDDKVPSCTTMVCLDYFTLDIKALRGALSS